MKEIGDIFQAILIWPILNILIGFYKFFSLLHFPWALAFAIVGMTVLVRLILWPLTKTQLESAKKLTALKPHLDELKKKHGHDKMRHQQEQAKLYKEHGINPAAGCLPLLLQMPIFIALYQVLLKVLNTGNGGDFIEGINKGLYFPFLKLTEAPNLGFVGLNLAQRPADLFSSAPLIILVPLLTGGLQFIQSKMMAPPSKKKEEPKTEGKGDMEKTMEQVQGQMLFLMPAMIAFFAYGFPIGLSLYWNTFTILGIIQQYLISGWGGVEAWLPAKWRNK
jgi:YidC/Oxa1 family membrane protein insertase